MPNTTLNTDGWNEWGRHVLAELERLNNWCSKLDDKLVISREEIKAEVSKLRTDVKSEIVLLKLKARIWYAVGGSIPIAIMIILILLKGYIG